MKIRVFPADNTGCGHYRLIWPTEVLIAQAEKHGHQIEIEPPGTRSLQAHIDPKTRTVIDVKVPEADVLVMQRVTHRYLSQAVSMLRQRGQTVVIDMDDDLSVIYPKNPAYDAMNPQRANRGQSDHSWEFAERACNDASLVTLSAPALAKRYAKHGRFEVLNNCLPAKVFDIKHEDSDLFGYPGAIHSHANDIPVVGSSVARLMRAGHRFATIADTNGITQLLKLPRDPDIEFGPVGVEEWWGRIAQLGIGMAPLADTVFNWSKSWLKPLEMSAVEVPCVISPRNEYRRIHQLGVGLLANSSREWYEQLERLLKDSTLRRDMGQQAKAAVAHLTYENRATQWLDAWVRARELDLQA